MNSFLVSQSMNAPVETVWQALADIGEIHVWNPGVQGSHTITAGEIGLGSARYCDLGGSNYLNEEVVLWEPNQAITMRVTETNLPLKSVDIRFTLEPHGNSTTVHLSPEYEVKFGFLGRFMNLIYVERSYKSGMIDLLNGLKVYVEKEV